MELAARYDKDYREVASKYGLVPHQDGPQNQKESNRALLPAPTELEANE
jgi:hypothetical protein